VTGKVTGKVMGRTARALLVALACAFAGCASFPVNPPIEEWRPRNWAGLRFAQSHRSDEILLIVSFSGGGTRAAAFAYGVLEELRQTPVFIDGKPRRLLDEVDIISGVSGGSFTAAYYGLHGEDTFDDFEERFLRRNVQADIVARLFYPTNWFRLGSTRFTRSDLAAEYYDKEIFDGATFADLGTGDGPSIVINATDFTRGNRFSFTPDQFDPLCNDLSSYPVSRAVTASSAVPGLFTPILVRNYHGRCGYQLPDWVRDGLRDGEHQARRYVQARVAESYVRPDAHDWVYLIDGGVTDNLGVRGAFERVVQEGGLETVLDHSGFGDAKRIVMIVVNAQTEPDLELDDLGFFQSLALMAGVASGIQINRFNFETLELVRTSFEHWARRSQRGEHPVQFDMAVVSFSGLRDEEESRYLNNQPTSFFLSDEAIDRLRMAGRRGLRESEAFQELLEELR